MNKIVIVLACLSIVAVLYASFIVDRQAKFAENKLTPLVNAINEKCPYMTDSTTRTDSATRSGNDAITIHISVLDTYAEDVDTGLFKEIYLIELTLKKKEKPLQFAKIDYTVTYKIYDMIGEHIVSIPLSPDFFKVSYEELSARRKKLVQ